MVDFYQKQLSAGNGIHTNTLNKWRHGHLSHGRYTLSVWIWSPLVHSFSLDIYFGQLAVYRWLLSLCLQGLIFASGYCSISITFGVCSSKKAGMMEALIAHKKRLPYAHSKICHSDRLFVFRPVNGHKSIIGCDVFDPKKLKKKSGKLLPNRL